MSEDNTHRTPVARFWAKVDKNGPIHPILKTRCWLWTGKPHARGYGSLRVGGGERMLAHRFSYELAHGPITDDGSYHGGCVCHECDNPICVNPAHLTLGTQAKNLADMSARGRRAHGEGHGMARLKAYEVVEIRQLLEQEYSLSEVARRYGVSRTTITSIYRGNLW